MVEFAYETHVTILLFLLGRRFIGSNVLRAKLGEGFNAPNVVCIIVGAKINKVAFKLNGPVGVFADGTVGFLVELVVDPLQGILLIVVEGEAAGRGGSVVSVWHRVAGFLPTEPRDDMLDPPGLFEAAVGLASESSRSAVKIVAGRVIGVRGVVLAVKVKGLFATSNFGLAVTGHVALLVGVGFGCVDESSFDAPGQASPLVLCVIRGGCAV